MANTGFIRPTLQELIDRVSADINARLPGADSRVRRSILDAITKMDAGAIHGLYGYLDFIARQAFPDSAEKEYLDRWASIWLDVPRKIATKATGPISLTGVNGSAIPLDAILTRADGIQYKTTTSASIASGVATVSVQALVAGASGNAASATPLTFVSPLIGVNATASTGSIAGATDTELDPDLLDRLLARIKQPPHGGSQSDYVQWALSVPGVTRAWCNPLELGAGTVTVRFVMDATYANGIPLSGDVAAVAAYIAPLRPVTAVVTVVAPVAAPLSFTIDLRLADTPAIRAAVEAELRDLILRDADPGGGLLLSRITEAISISTGEQDHALTSPAANVTTAAGQIVTFGSITWV